MGWLAPAFGIAIGQSMVDINRGRKDPTTKQANSIGISLPKNSFQNHGVDDAGKVIKRQSLRQRQVIHFLRMAAPFLLGIDVLGTSRFMVREQWALCHEVTLLLAIHVKA